MTMFSVFLNRLYPQCQCHIDWLCPTGHHSMTMLCQGTKKGMQKILKIPNIRFYQPGRCDTRCSPTPYRLTLFDRTPLNDDLWIIFFIMMASGAPLARFFCDTPHSAYTKALVIHSVNKTHFLLFRKQLICVTQTNILHIYLMNATVFFDLKD